jgi:integrase/recombinase XerC
VSVVKSDPFIDGWRTAQRRRGLQPGTIEARLRHVIRLQAYMAAQKKALIHVNRDDIELFLDRCHIGSKSRYGYLSSFSCFYRWAIKEGLAKVNPAEDIERPKLPHYLPRPADTDELGVAIQLAPMPEKAFLLLAAYAGLRCKEISGMQWPDVLETSRPPMILVSEGKGARQRLVPLHADVRRALHHLPSTGRSGYVFIRPYGGRYAPHEVSQVINAHLHDLGISHTAHSLRHWFGTNVYRATHDLRLVQELMGHASPTTTAVYTAFDPGEGVDAVLGLSAERPPPADPWRDVPAAASILQMVPGGRPAS